MENMREFILSAARLSLALLALALVTSSPAAATDYDGGCKSVTNSDWACAKGNDLTIGAYCKAGATQGCETCARSDVSDTCFDGQSQAFPGWTPETYSE